VAGVTWRWPGTSPNQG